MLVDTQPSPDIVAASPSAGPADTSRRAANRGSFVVCLSAALALNLFALGVFAAVTTRWQATPANAARTTWITATTVRSAPETDAAPEQPSRAAPPAEPRDTAPIAATERAPLPTDAPPPGGPPVPTSVPTPMPTPMQPPDQPPVQLSPTPATSTTEGEPTRFYGFGEVDRPAEPAPESDWNLDTAALDAWGVQTLVFDIFVSRTGEVVDCRIVEPQALPDEARSALQQRVRETVLQPALRDRMAVASMRRIEMTVAPPGL